MSMFYLLSLLLFESVACYWHEECDVLPAARCTCYNHTGRPHVICRDLGLLEVPSFRHIENHEPLDVDLSRNIISQMTRSAFGHIWLNKLVLSDNGYPLPIYIAPDALTREQRERLTSLTLANDGLISIPAIVRGMGVLNELDLSGNQIRLIENNDLEGLTKLHQLNLAGNPIQSVSGLAFLAISSLKEFAITFDNNTVEHVRDIRDIVGKENIDNVRSELRQLVIVDTQLTKVRFLQSFTNLQLVRLRSCGLSYRVIAKHGSQLLSPSRRRLTYVDLSHNHIDYFPEQIFETCTKLEHIDISHNRLQSLGFNEDTNADDNYYMYGSGEHVIYDQMTFLDVSYNALTHLMWWELSLYPSLNHLDVSNNLIAVLGRDILQSIPQLETFDLSNNRLLTIQQTSFPTGFPAWLTLTIHDNRFVCNCTMKWLVEAFGKQSETGIGPFDWYDVYNVQCEQGYQNGPVSTIMEVYANGIIDTECGPTHVHE